MRLEKIGGLVCQKEKMEEMSEMEETEKFKEIEIDIKSRLSEIVNISWNIFLNHYINKKYTILLESPFQLHFSEILSRIGNLYCLKREEHFFVDLEVKNTEINNGRYYIDIVCGIIRGEKEYKIALELKFKTLQQSAEDLGVMEFYKDIYSLEKIISKGDYLFGVFLAMTNNNRYVKKPSRGLKMVFNTHNKSFIVPKKEYKYFETKTGEKFYNDYGSFKFKQKHQFNWKKHKDNYFLKMFIR